MKSMSKQLEDHKASIERLYIQEDKTGKEVLASLRDEFQFEATENQLKKKLKQWNFDNKNVRAGTMEQIARSRAKQSLENKPSAFRVNKTSVLDRKIDRFMDRKQMTLDDLIEMPTPQSAPSPAFSVFTPATWISTPPAMAGFETIDPEIAPSLEFNSLSVMDSRETKSLSPADAWAATFGVDKINVTDAKASAPTQENDVRPQESLAAAVSDGTRTSYGIPKDRIFGDISSEAGPNTAGISAVPIYPTEASSLFGPGRSVEIQDRSDNIVPGRNLGFPLVTTPVTGNTTEDMKRYLDARQTFIDAEKTSLRERENAATIRRMASLAEIWGIVNHTPCPEPPRPNPHYYYRRPKTSATPRKSRYSEVWLWTCHMCAHEEMNVYILSCPMCDHARCPECMLSGRVGQRLL